MIIRFYYKSFPCLHGASVYQYDNDRLSLDVGLSSLDCPCVLLTVAKVRTFSTPQKLFTHFFAKKRVFLCFSRLVYVCTFRFAILDIAIRTFNEDYQALLSVYQYSITPIQRCTSAMVHVQMHEHAPSVCTHVRMYARVYVCACVNMRTRTRTP